MAKDIRQIYRFKALLFPCLILIVLLGLQSNLSAQGLKEIKGIIKDGVTHQPLPGVTITIKNNLTDAQAKLLLSDSKGEFRIPHIQDSVALTFSLVGYIMKEAVLPWSVKTAEVLLVADNQMLNAVTVSGKKPLIVRKADRLVLNVAGTGIAAKESALAALRSVPGVFVNINNVITLQGRTGVKIYVNDKPLGLSRQDVDTYLKSLGADQIERIEVITSPSAKYDADGTAGILNIILKQNSFLGVSSRTSAKFTQGKYTRYRFGESLDFNLKKVSFSSLVSFGEENEQDLTSGDRTNFVTNQSFLLGYDQKIKTLQPLLKLNVEYRADKKNIFNLIWNSNWATETIRQSNYQQLISGQSDSTFTTLSTTRNKVQKYSVNADYKRIIDSADHYIQASIHYSSYSSPSNAYLDMLTYGPNKILIQPSLVTKIINPTDIDVLVGKIDYNHILFSRIKLEAGLKSSMVRTRSNSRYLIVTKAKDSVDNTRSNNFEYTEHINAGYASLQMELRKFNLQLGIRAENTNSNANLISANSSYKRSYLNFFPSLFVSYNPDEANSFSLSLNKRITRPSYQDLNPYIFVIDKYNSIQGNPYLNPEISKYIEVNYLLKSKYNFSVNYSYVGNSIFQVPTIETTQTILRPENLSHQKTFSFNVTIPVDITKFWNLNLNTSLLRNITEYQNLVAGSTANKATSLTFSAENTFTFKTYKFNLAGSYTSANSLGIYRIRPVRYMDLSVQKSFSKSLSATFSLSDVFKSYREVISYNIISQAERTVQTRDSRLFSLGLIYRFKKGKAKTIDKSVVAQEELDRIK